jgi:cell division protein FtsX
MLTTKIHKFIVENLDELSKNQIKALLDVGVKPRNQVSALRRTVTKPILVKEVSFMRNGQKVTRKAHRRAKRGKAV